MAADDVVGLVPAAAGHGGWRRCRSKEIHPIGFRRYESSGHVQIEAVSQQLLVSYSKCSSQPSAVANSSP
jgi:hypothetical protein